MTDSELNKILRQAKMPEPSAEYWDELPRRVARRLSQGGGPNRPTARWRLRLSWGLAVATVCLAIGFAVGTWRGQQARNAPNGNLLANTKLVKEVMAMFPHRLRAIVQDTDGLHLILSQTSDVPDSTPLFIEVRQGKQSSSYITFSGQEIRIDGRAVTVLSNARGGVILVGNRFLWSNRKFVGAADDLEIEARELTHVSAG